MKIRDLDNHDPRIRYVSLMLEGELSGVEEIPLPPGYRYAMYRPGDRDAWIAIEISARELRDRAQGLVVWEKYYGGHESEMPERMCFIENAEGEKIATATAYYDVSGRDASGDAWLHWVAVARPEQGKGLSKPLVTHTVHIMKRLGYTKVKISTQTTTWVACKVYLDLGFRPCSACGEEQAQGWRIVKSLTDHPALAHVPPAGEDEIFG